MSFHCPRGGDPSENPRFASPTMLFWPPMSGPNLQPHSLRAGMVGMGMIFEETYRPMFEALHAGGLYRKDFGFAAVSLAAVATRTGARARAYKKEAGELNEWTEVWFDHGGTLIVCRQIVGILARRPDHGKSRRQGRWRRVSARDAPGLDGKTVRCRTGGGPRP